MNTPISTSARGQARHVSLAIEGMTCASCVGRVERVLSRVPGVVDVRVNLATERADLHASSDVTREALTQAVERAGYHVGEHEGVDAVDGPPDSAARGAKKLQELRRSVVFAVLLSLPVVLLEMGGHLVPAFHHFVAAHVGERTNRAVQLLFTSLVMAGPGRQIFTHGLRGLWRRAPDMNSLVSLGTLSAYAYSLVATVLPNVLPAQSQHVYYEAAAVVLTLILLGRWLEAKAKGRTSEALSRLVKLSPDVATVRRDGAFIDLRTRDVVLDDWVLVKPGSRIPVDGVVVEGESRVDESMLTGEPNPVHKLAAAPLHAGTVNQTGSIIMRATAVGGDTLLAQIVRMVEQAQGSKLPIQALVDRITGWFVPAVMAIAAVTFGMWFLFGPEPRVASALVAAVSVLIIACPCAMGLATPTSILVGTGRGAELGLLFRHGEALQRLQETNVVAFDKTGTLTVGQPTLTDWVDAPSFSRDSTLVLLASVESRSEHPIAKAVVDKAINLKLNLLPVTAFRNEVGMAVLGTVDGHEVAAGAPRYFARPGVELGAVESELSRWQEEGKTALLVTVDHRVAAAFAVSDPIKPTAARAVSEINALGIEVAMITGDHQATARAVAAQLGIKHVVAGVLPDGKVSAIRVLRQTHGVAAFVGDGINDAPVLAEADVGIAMGAGTDIAIEAAGVILMRDDLEGVPVAIALSRATLRNIRENLFWAFAYNAALIPVAAGALYPAYGLTLSPMLGGLAMAVSSVFVLLNALRLRRFRAGGGAHSTPVLVEVGT
jgi:heavy metal translocating P-type ATPase